MLTREQVLVALLLEGAMRRGDSVIYRDLKAPRGFMCADEIFIWNVRTLDGRLLEFADEDVLEAVDTFINCQPAIIEFPDADELREFNKRTLEAEYKQWCESHAEYLAMIASAILQAYAKGKRTIEFDLPRNEAEGNYLRYFKERHYDVRIQKYSDENVEKRGYRLCKLDWSSTPRRR